MPMSTLWVNHGVYTRNLSRREIMLKAQEKKNLTFTTENRIGRLNAVCDQISTQGESSEKLEWTEKQLDAAGRPPS